MPFRPRDDEVGGATTRDPRGACLGERCNQTRRFGARPGLSRSCRLSAETNSHVRWWSSGALWAADRIRGARIPEAECLEA
jgi:hypothetical protein